MANDNNNTNELVAVDADQTAEFDTPTWRGDEATGRDEIPVLDVAFPDDSPQSIPIRNRDQAIRDLKADLTIKTQTIDRLQFDVERLRSRRVGLETEVEARETQTRQLASALEDAGGKIQALTEALADAKQYNSVLSGQLETLHKRHEQEIRTLRFELTEAADTVAQQELINEQLASDLVDTRGFKSQLEQMLTSSEQQNQSRVAQLERELAELGKANEAFEQELAAKNEAIADLLEQLTGKTRQEDSLSELEAAIDELDERVAERLDEKPLTERDRVTRMLIGKFGDQELRFPLFKSRLTIGRAVQNDIQLQAGHISRRHAVIMTEGDTARVVDWGSKNGVYVNSRRVTEHFLKSGDRVTIGDASFRYEERPKREA
jgi:predicted  nucleic acid-binding Zn-ribbon protein